MSTDQTDLVLSGDYHLDVNLLLKRQEYDANTMRSLKSDLLIANRRVAELERQMKNSLTPCEKLEVAEKRVESQLKLLDVAGKHIELLDDRVAELERALLYYADECNFKNGDVPGHVYALDDGGHTARTALGLNQDQVKERILATYYTE